MRNNIKIKSGQNLVDKEEANEKELQFSLD